MYTRKGDSGETSLNGKARVAKDSPRVEAYGSIDELSSVLGVAITLSNSPEISEQLRVIQRLLFKAGADAATQYGESQHVARISKEDTLEIESLTDGLLGRLPTLRNFILPGGSPMGAQLHLARAVCRRSERRLLTASRTEKMNPELIPFFNRLSSYLFNLARRANKEAGFAETVWTG